MKVKVITVATYAASGLDMLKKSMRYHKADYTVLCQGEQWKGFGMKIIRTAEYLKTLPSDYTHFIFVDAYDVAFVRSVDRVMRVYNLLFKDQIVFSTEKACWPDVSLTDQYPLCEGPWRFLNSGTYMAPIKQFLELIDNNPVQMHDDDQLYFSKLFLQGKLVLDTKCEMFQSIAFADKKDFAYDWPGFRNRLTGSSPAIIHGNGRTPMDKIYELI